MSSKIYFLTFAAPNMTAAMNEETVLDVTNAVESFHLSTKATAARGALLQAAWMVCCVDTEDFRVLHDMHGRWVGENPGESVKLLLCDRLQKCLSPA